jgi:hypothetical protein
MSRYPYVSAAATALLESIEQQAGVSLEIIQVPANPLREPASGLLSAIESPAISEEVLKAFRTGEVRAGRVAETAFGVFPLRREREIVGCLIASGRLGGGGTALERGREVDEAGALARGVVEADLAVYAQLGTTRALTRRLRGTLRFLGELNSYRSERALMQAVLQAASVWFDLDCRVYEKRPEDGGFLLMEALPGGGDMPEAARRLAPARVAQLVAQRRFPSAADLDDLALGGRRDEVLVLPVDSGDAEWVILLAGTLDGHIELTFTTMARALTSELRARELAVLDRWQQQLASLPTAIAGSPDRMLLHLLEALVRETGAQGGRVTLGHPESGARTIAAVGPAVARIPREESDGRNAQIQLAFAVAARASMQVTLFGRDLAGSGAATEARGWVRALRPWLAAVAGLPRQPHSAANAETPAFEKRIQEEIERARRFNLGLGLIVIGPGTGNVSDWWGAFDNLEGALRRDLRASDLFGPLSDGLVAVLLVHAAAQGAGSVAARLEARLSKAVEGLPPGGLQVGTAMFSPQHASAAELIAFARRQSRVILSIH